MSKPKVVVARRSPGASLDGLRERYDVWIWEEDGSVPRETLKEQLHDAEGLLAMFTNPIDADILAAAPKLRVVSNYGVGFNNIDVETCTRRGIPVGYTPGVVTEATADQAFALMLAASRRIVEGVQYVRAGRWRDWSPTLLISNDVYGKTLGFLGMGRIGQAIARRAVGFAMPMVYYARNRRREAEQAYGVQYLSFGQVLAEADILVVIVPMTPQTHHMVDAAALRRMKPTAILVNVARGPIVDSAALYEALRDGVIRAAALDVTDPEPLPPDDPLLTLENCLIVPHVGTSTWETREAMTDLAVENLIRGMEGRPMAHCANPEVERSG